eukprot:tig00000630_g2681.t1
MCCARTELAERKRKLAAARTLNAEGAPGPSVQFSIDSVLSRLRLAEDADRLRLLMGAVPGTSPRASGARLACWRARRSSTSTAWRRRPRTCSGLLVLSSDPAYTPERLAKGIMGVEARCIMRNSRAFITRHESSAVWASGRTPASSPTPTPSASC